jgi:hypothetical protein
MCGCVPERLFARARAFVSPSRFNLEPKQSLRTRDVSRGRGGERREGQGGGGGEREGGGRRVRGRGKRERKFMWNSLAHIRSNSRRIQSQETCVSAQRRLFIHWQIRAASSLYTLATKSLTTLKCLRNRSKSPHRIPATLKFLAEMLAAYAHCGAEIVGP